MEVLQNFQTMFNNKLDPRMQSHLRNVYASILSATMVASLGTVIHMNGIWQGGILSALGSFILMMMIAGTRHPDGKDEGKRFAYLNGLALCTGVSTGPLVEIVWEMNPAVVVSALLYTCVIFGSFSLSALFATEGKFLFLGGPILSITSAMLVTAIVNLFVQSTTVSYIQLLLGLAVMSAFILYDTHLMMDKVRMGDKDYIWHSLNLFIDLVSLFKHILVLLAEKEQSGQRSKKSSS